MFRTYAASYRSAVGFTAIAIFGDEMARWRDEDTGSNPAEEIVATLVPATATQPTAFIFLISSAFGTEDYHARRVDMGDTDFQRVFIATSWEANPSITEAFTRSIQPDVRAWRREFASIPQAGAVGAFDPDEISEAIRSFGGIVVSGAELLIDSSAGKGDRFSWALFSWMRITCRDPEWEMINAVSPTGELLAKWVTPKRDADGNRIKNANWHPPRVGLRMHSIGGFGGKFAEYKTATDVVAEIAKVAKRHHVTRVFGDQYQEFVLQSEFARHQLPYHGKAWTNQTKVDAMARVRQWFRERSLVIDPGPEAIELRKELLAYQETILPSGAVSFAARRGAHDDRTALLLLAARLDIEGSLRGSPIQKSTAPVYFADDHYKWG